MGLSLNSRLESNKEEEEDRHGQPVGHPLAPPRREILLQWVRPNVKKILGRKP